MKRNRNIYECDGGASPGIGAGDAGASTPSIGDSTTSVDSSQTGTTDVIGDCDHQQNGFLGTGCFHVPYMVGYPYSRLSTYTQKKRKKNRKKKTKNSTTIKVIKNYDDLVSESSNNSTNISYVYDIPYEKIEELISKSNNTNIRFDKQQLLKYTYPKSQAVFSGLFATNTKDCLALAVTSYGNILDNDCCINEVMTLISGHSYGKQLIEIILSKSENAWLMCDPESGEELANKLYRKIPLLEEVKLEHSCYDDDDKNIHGLLLYISKNANDFDMLKEQLIKHYQQKNLNEVDIANDDVYLSNMSKTFLDKGWFIPYIPLEIDTIVDFGGGEGEFADYCKSISKRPYRYIIIDNNQTFLNNAIAKGFIGYSSLDELMNDSKNFDPSKTLLSMSSVIHEVYSYSDPFFDDPGTFWTNIKKCNFKAIAIRDMTFSEQTTRKAPIDSILWIYQKILKSNTIKFKGELISNLVDSFEEHWGAICDVEHRKVNIKRLIHFLFKYRYVENWEREVNENYLPLSQDKLDYYVSDYLGYRYLKKFNTHLNFYSKAWRKDLKLNSGDNYGHKIAFAQWLDTLNTHIKILGIKD